MTLRTKLVFGYLLVGMLAGVVGLTGAITGKKVNDEFAAVARETMPFLRALYDLRHAGMRIVSATTEYEILAAESGTGPNSEAREKGESQLLEQGKRLFEEAITRYHKLVLLYDPQDSVFFREARTAGQNLQRVSDEFVMLEKRGVAGPLVLEKEKEFQKAEQDYLAAVQAAIAHQVADFDERTESVRQSIYKNARAILLAVSLSLLLALGASIYMSRSISSPISRLRDAAIQLGKGQLDATVEVRSKDEIGVLAETFNYMRISLKNRLEELKEAHAQALREERMGLVGRMASSIIHDFRGPMQIIQGSAELLAMPELNLEKRERHSRIIIQQIGRMANMTQELLDYAKGESHARRVVLDVEDLLTELNFQTEELCRNSPVRFDAELKKPFQLWADKEKILRVLMNLIRNAKEAMPGGGSIRVVTFLDRVEGVIQVIDDGPGIPKELAGRLFEPFATFGKAGGTGLGLALSKKIIEEHGGTIQCESEPGKGTTFTIRLPAGERVALETLTDTDTTKILV